MLFESPVLRNYSPSAQLLLLSVPMCSCLADVFFCGQGVEQGDHLGNCLDTLPTAVPVSLGFLFPYALPKAAAGVCLGKDLKLWFVSCLTQSSSSLSSDGCCLPNLLLWVLSLGQILSRLT